MKMDIKKRIKLKMVYCVLLLILGVASLCVAYFVPIDSGNTDYSTGYYTGLGFGVIAASVITFVKNLLLLKNPQKLKEREIYESDERNRMIGLKTWSWAGYTMFILLYIAQMVAAMFNVVITQTLLVVLGVFALCLLICRMVLTKIM